MSEQQSGCAKCEALREEAQEEYQHRLMKVREFLNHRLMEIYLEHDRGEHIGKIHEGLYERLREWCTRGDHAEDTG